MLEARAKGSRAKIKIGVRSNFIYLITKSQKKVLGTLVDSLDCKRAFSQLRGLLVGFDEVLKLEVVVVEALGHHKRRLRLLRNRVVF